MGLGKILMWYSSAWEPLFNDVLTVDHLIEFNKAVCCLREALSCSVCSKLLPIEDALCPSECREHFVCKGCIGHDRKNERKCSLCEDWSTYEKDDSLTNILRSYSDLCLYFLSLSNIHELLERLHSDSHIDCIKLTRLVIEGYKKVDMLKERKSTPTNNDRDIKTTGMVCCTATEFIHRDTTNENLCISTNSKKGYLNPEVLTSFTTTSVNNDTSSSSIPVVKKLYSEVVQSDFKTEFDTTVKTVNDSSRKITFEKEPPITSNITNASKVVNPVLSRNIVRLPLDPITTSLPKASSQIDEIKTESDTACKTLNDSNRKTPPLRQTSVASNITTNASKGDNTASCRSIVRRPLDPIPSSLPKACSQIVETKTEFDTARKTVNDSNHKTPSVRETPIASNITTNASNVGDTVLSRNVVRLPLDPIPTSLPNVCSQIVEKSIQDVDKSETIKDTNIITNSHKPLRVTETCKTLRLQNSTSITPLKEQINLKCKSIEDREIEIIELTSPEVSSDTSSTPVVLPYNIITADKQPIKRSYDGFPINKEVHLTPTLNTDITVKESEITATKVGHTTTANQFLITSSGDITPQSMSTNISSKTTVIELNMDKLANTYPTKTTRNVTQELNTPNASETFKNTATSKVVPCTQPTLSKVTLSKPCSPVTSLTNKPANAGISSKKAVSIGPIPTVGNPFKPSSESPKKIATGSEYKSVPFVIGPTFLKPTSVNTTTTSKKIVPIITISSEKPLLNTTTIQGTNKRTPSVVTTTVSSQVTSNAPISSHRILQNSMCTLPVSSQTTSQVSETTSVGSTPTFPNVSASDSPDISQRSSKVSASTTAVGKQFVPQVSHVSASTRPVSSQTIIMTSAGTTIPPVSCPKVSPVTVCTPPVVSQPISGVPASTTAVGKQIVPQVSHVSASTRPVSSQTISMISAGTPIPPVSCPKISPVTVCTPPVVSQPISGVSASTTLSNRQTISRISPPSPMVCRQTHSKVSVCTSPVKSQTISQVSVCTPPIVSQPISKVLVSTTPVSRQTISQVSTSQTVTSQSITKLSVCTTPIRSQTHSKVSLCTAFVDTPGASSITTPVSNQTILQVSASTTPVSSQRIPQVSASTTPVSSRTIPQVSASTTPVSNQTIPQVSASTTPVSSQTISQVSASTIPVSSQTIPKVSVCTLPGSNQPISKVSVCSQPVSSQTISQIFIRSPAPAITSNNQRHPQVSVQSSMPTIQAMTSLPVRASTLGNQTISQVCVRAPTGYANLTPLTFTPTQDSSLLSLRINPANQSSTRTTTIEQLSQDADQHNQTFSVSSAAPTTTMNTAAWTKPSSSFVSAGSSNFAGIPIKVTSNVITSSAQPPPVYHLSSTAAGLIRLGVKSSITQQIRLGSGNIAVHGRSLPVHLIPTQTQAGEHGFTTVGASGVPRRKIIIASNDFQPFSDPSKILHLTTGTDFGRLPYTPSTAAPGPRFATVNIRTLAGGSLVRPAANVSTTVTSLNKNLLEQPPGPGVTSLTPTSGVSVSVAGPSPAVQMPSSSLGTVAGSTGVAMLRKVAVTATSPSATPIATLKRKFDGCRCGNTTNNPGKLTCIGQRCACYSDGNACSDCKCKGCKNPYVPGSDGQKVLHGVKALLDPQTNQAIPRIVTGSISTLGTSSGSSVLLKNPTLTTSGGIASLGHPITATIGGGPLRLGTSISGSISSAPHIQLIPVRLGPPGATQYIQFPNGSIQQLPFILSTSGQLPVQGSGITIQGISGIPVTGIPNGIPQTQQQQQSKTTERNPHEGNV